MDCKSLEKTFDRSSFTYKISKGITIAQSPCVGFSMPLTFFYTVVETGETFTGNTGHAKEDYMTWKAKQRMELLKTSHLMPTQSINRKEEPMDIP